MFDDGLNGKRVLITGGARGIGLAAAMRFARAGSRVVVNDLTSAGTAEAVAGLSRDGLDAGAVVGSVANKAGCDAIVAEACEQMGGLDILVNCAGVYLHGPCEEFSEEDWDLTLDVNLKGTFFTTMAAMPHLQSSGGNVVNLASEAGLRGCKFSAVYCASKGGIVLLTKSMALEYAPEVRINCVCPGAVNTQMMWKVANASGDADAYMQAVADSYALKRIAEPAEIAGAICYLASDLAANITGAALAIDGGSTAGR
jgi:NAD(P)-dependent dehydrogenase (short-subunit alcohol dehydrogenase family)